MPLRSLDFGPDGVGLVTFLVYPPYLHPPVTASVRFGGYAIVLAVVWGVLSPSLSLIAAGSCERGGRVRGREAPAQRRRRRP
jgi:hypothetical protein